MVKDTFYSETKQRANSDSVCLSIFPFVTLKFWKCVFNAIELSQLTEAFFEVGKIKC